MVLNMVEKFSISNILKIDGINSKKAKVVYKDNNGSVKEILLKSAEKCWLKKYPNNSLLQKLDYIGNGVHYVANRGRSLEYRTLTFFLPNGYSIQFYSDATNEIKFVQTINLLHSHNWGTMDTN